MLEVLAVTVIASWLISREQKSKWDPVINIAYGRAYRTVEDFLIGSIPIDIVSDRAEKVYRIGDEIILPILIENLPRYPILNARIIHKVEKLKDGLEREKEGFVDELIVKLNMRIEEARIGILNLLNLNIQYADPILSKELLKFDASLLYLQKSFIRRRSMMDYLNELVHGLTAAFVDSGPNLPPIPG